MTRQVRSEWRKVFTIKLWWGMLLGSCAFAAFAVVAQIASNGQGRSDALPLSTATTQQSIFASAASGEIFSLVLGIIIMTTEYRHFTSRPTFLTEPRRGRVIVAKIVVALAVGILYGIACAAITTAIAVPWLSARGVTIGWSANSLRLVLLGALFAVAIYGVLGVGLGVLLRNQVAAVISALAYLFILEPLVAVIPWTKGAYRFLPGATAASMTAYGTSRSRGGLQITLLEPWQGALLLFGWGLLFAFLGWLLTLRRDVT